MMQRMGYLLSNWNDHRHKQDRVVDESWCWRVIDRIAWWLYVRGDDRG